MNFTTEQLAALRKAYDVIKTFRDVDPNMSIITAATLLEVGLRGDNGVSVKYLEKALDLPAASASRQLQICEKPNERRKKGLSLVEPRLDPYDPKGKIRVPLKEMESLVVKLQSAVN